MNRKIKVRIKSASEESEYTFFVDKNDNIMDVYYAGYTSQGQSGFAGFIQVQYVSEMVMKAFRIQLESEEVMEELAGEGQKLGLYEYKGDLK